MSKILKLTRMRYKLSASIDKLILQKSAIDEKSSGFEKQIDDIDKKIQRTTKMMVAQSALLGGNIRSIRSKTRLRLLDRKKIRLLKKKANVSKKSTRITDKITIMEIKIERLNDKVNRLQK